MNLNTELFERRYRQLLYVTYKEYPAIDNPSFTNGYWEDQEGYKRILWTKAREEMSIDTWFDRQNDIDYIFKKASQPFWIRMPGTSRHQNLVSAPNYEKLILTNDSRVKRETSEALRSLYYGDDDKAAFEKLSKVMAKTRMNDPLSVVSMFFFLKNKTPEGDYQYVTSRKDGTAERLSKLGANPACVQICTWDNYQEYLSIIHDIQLLLKKYHPEASLLDAQSFLWMLQKIDDRTPEHKTLVSDSNLDHTNKNDEALFDSSVDDSGNEDPLESNVTVQLGGFTEGKQKQFFGTRYERDPRVRKAFLATKTLPYKCEVCGIDFESKYGDLGKGVIEVHHKKPLYIDGVEQEIQPTNEYLACLCANCHRMIHKPKDKVMSVEELKQIFYQQEQSRDASSEMVKKSGIKVKTLPKASLRKNS